MGKASHLFHHSPNTCNIRLSSYKISPHPQPYLSMLSLSFSHESLSPSSPLFSLSLNSSSWYMLFKQQDSLLKSVVSFFFLQALPSNLDIQHLPSNPFASLRSIHRYGVSSSLISQHSLSHQFFIQAHQPKRLIYLTSPLKC